MGLQGGELGSLLNSLLEFIGFQGWGGGGFLKRGLILNSEQAKRREAQSDPVHDCSEVSPTEFTEIYSPVSKHRIAGLRAQFRFSSDQQWIFFVTVSLGCVLILQQAFFKKCNLLNFMLQSSGFYSFHSHSPPMNQTPFVIDKKLMNEQV